jgi:hypothetical protein
MPKNVLETIPNSGHKKFKIKKGKGKAEKDVNIEILGDDDDSDFEVQKLSVEGLPAKFGADDIAWLNNFAIKKRSTQAHINQPFKIKIAGLSAARDANKKIVILDSNSGDAHPYEFTGTIIEDTFEFTDGDPAVGSAPP